MAETAKEAILWSRCRQALGKWARDEELLPEDRKALIAGQDRDVNRYKRMREEARDYTPRCSTRCW